MTALSDQTVLDELPALLRYARALTRNEHDAEDLVHDALTSAYAKRGQFRQGSPLAQWLFAIVRNRFFDQWRSARRQEGAMADLAQLSPTESSPSQEDGFRLAQLEQLFAALPDEQREALHLVVVEGLSYQSAAAIIDVPIGTLMSRLSRARLRLREAEDGRDTAATPLRLVKD